MSELVSVIASHNQERTFAQLVDWLVANIFHYGETELDAAKKAFVANSRARNSLASALANFRTREPFSIVESKKEALNTIEWLVTYTGPTSTIYVTCDCGERAGYTPAAGHANCHFCGLELKELTGHRQFNYYPTAEQSGIEVKLRHEKRRPGKMSAKKLDGFQDEQEEMDGERWDGLS